MYQNRGYTHIAYYLFFSSAILVRPKIVFYDLSYLLIDLQVLNFFFTGIGHNCNPDFSHLHKNAVKVVTDVIFWLWISYSCAHLTVPM